MGVAGRRLQIAVAGGGACSASTGRMARRLGREIARAGAVLICGGLGGVMEAVARGAAEEGGTVVGLLPGYAHRDGNPHLTIALPTGLGYARNVLVAGGGDVLIALPGEQGTRSEIALAQVLRRPVIGLGAWGDVPGITRVRTAAAAVARARVLTRGRRRRR